MSTFSSRWLQLRETVDGTARSAAMVDALRRAAPASRVRRIVDLATGTGANLRYLAPRLGGRQDWLLVDRDATLLAELVERTVSWAAGHRMTAVEDGTGLTLTGPGFECRACPVVLDLAADLDRLELQGRWLVTASALLDLVSERWLSSLAERCRAAGATVLFALTYDGRMRCCPALPIDTLVSEMVNCHQRSDKGFGRALGPDAAALTPRLFQRLGYRLQQRRSTWRLGPGDRTLQADLVSGWATAAAEFSPALVPEITDWAEQRRVLIERGRSWVQVGHRDMLGWPP